MTRPGALRWETDGADWPNRSLSRFVAAGALRWHVQETAPEGRPSVLLLHGTGASTASWRGLIRAAGAEWRMLVPDLPGHGFTGAPPLHPLGLPAMTADVSALLAATGFRPDIVAGHSAGGAIALRLALDGRVAPKAILLVNPALEPFRGAAGFLFPLFARMIWLAPFSGAFAARFASSPGTLDRLLAGTGSTVDAEGRASYARLLANPVHAGAALGMMAQWDLRELARALPGLTVPVTFLLGRRDGFVPAATTAEIARGMPRAAVREFAELGHLLHEEAPEVVAEALAGLMAAP